MWIFVNNMFNRWPLMIASVEQVIFVNIKELALNMICLD